MTDTIGSVPARIDLQQLAQQLIETARAEGVELVGPGGLLAGLTKTVLETALEAEMTEHLGYEAHDVEGRDGGNSRNGTRTKTVLTEIGPVQIEVPRDRDASFSPVIVRKRQRRLNGIDEIVLSLTARGLTTGEVAAHFEEVYGATISKDTISKITDKVIDELTEWQNRPLDAVYPVLFVDAIHLKVRDGHAHLPTVLRGHRGHHRRAPRHPRDLGRRRRRGRQVLAAGVDRDQEPRRRRRVHRGMRRPQGPPRVDHHGVAPGPGPGLCAAPDPQHLPLRLPQVLGTDGQGPAPVYTAPTEDAAAARFEEFDEKWGQLYPAIVTLWRRSWSEFVPFLDYDVEIRRVICSNNAIESVNARYRRAVKARGHFPTEQAALKCLYLVTRSLDPTGKGRARWAVRWKPALNAFAIAFEGRIVPSNGS